MNGLQNGYALPYMNIANKQTDILKMKIKSK